jgi:two-component system, chemotaxis family, sensor kinase CheA
VSSAETDNTFFAKFLDDYFAECDEHLTVIRRDLLALEPLVGQSTIDRPLFNELLRGFHTLKGLSGMVGVQEAEELSHQLESYLRSLHDETMRLTANGLDILIAGTRAIEQVVAAHRTNSLAPDCAPLLRQLEALVRAKSPKASTESPAVNVEVDRQLANALQSGSPIWRFEYTPTAVLSERGVNVNSVRTRLQGLGKLLLATPRASADGAISFEFLVAGPVDVNSLAGWENDGLTWAPYDAPPTPEVAPMSQEDKSSTQVPSHESYLAPTTMVRVDLSRLDELMQMVGDLVISRARLDGNLQGLDALLPHAQARALQETNQAIERQLRSLREGVMRVRMVPIADVFERMQFIVRDLSREYGKRVRLDLAGKDTEIDKCVVERMMDPLLHLVRNAISHGLETPEEREASGKGPEGRLALRASTAGDAVVLEIEDDGRGIDVERVMQRSLAKGLIDADQQLDAAALLEILCTPGFSTRDKTDRVSGRGVGMDVVKTTIAELGGTIRLDSKPGFGTRFAIQLPLTLAIVDALIVTVSGHLFAMPALSVREVIEVRPDDIIALENNDIVRYRGGVLPVVRLAKIFHLPEPSRDACAALILDSGVRTLGVLVDRVCQQREIVVRTLADPLLQMPGIAGATELGDGRVVLILDAASLAGSIKMRPSKTVAPQMTGAPMPNVWLDTPYPSSTLTQALC